MNNKIERLINILRDRKETISFMESCTGGYCTNSITNIPGSSDIIKFSAVTYSNEFKIKLGVDKSIIDKYTVYSIETSISMAKSIKLFSNSSIGVGITGMIGNIDKYNEGYNIDNVDDVNKINNRINQVYYSIIYNDNIISKTINVNGDRKSSKEEIFNNILDNILDLLK